MENVQNANKYGGGPEQFETPENYVIVFGADGQIVG